MTKYKGWTRYFLQNHWPEFPRSAPRLTGAERALIAKSIQQFQLGEGASGQTFLRLGRAFADEEGEPDYPESLALFIAEEHRHSARLGDFMDHEGIPRLTRDRANGLFRWLRKLWGHECIVTVLVSAECVAVPYYSALHDATASPWLRALCRQILRDEQMHLKYQGQTLARLGKRRGFWLASVARTLQAGAVLGATLVVYAQHRALFRATAWPLEDVLEASFEALAQVQRRTEGQRRRQLCLPR
ncbi:MAG: hypothetical protein K2X03_16335 [Bryobacteraceae bacterium]|nr:hypothetical protein [Bryobacteraceae bacterium]